MFYKALLAGNLTVMTILVEAGVSLNDGYEDPSDILPLKLAKQGCEPWIIKHLISLDAQQTDEEADTKVFQNTVRGVRISERTWEWVGRY